MRILRLALISMAWLSSTIGLLALNVAPAAAQKPDEPPQGAYSHGTRTDIPVVDQVLRAIENDESLLDHLQFVSRACTTQPHDGEFRCPEGVANGTVLESVFSGTCQTFGIAASSQAGLELAFGNIDSSYYLFGVGRRTSSSSVTPPGGYYTVYLVSGPGPAVDAFVDRYVRLYVGESGIFGRSACDPLGIALPEEPEIVLPAADGGEESPNPSLVQFGDELATLVEAGNFEGVLQRWEPEQVTCPAEFSKQLCEGVADGQTAEGYPVGVFGSELPVQPAAQAIESLRNLRLDLAGSDVRLCAAGVKDLADLTCGDCILTLSTPSDADPGATVRVIAFWVSGQGNDLLVQYVIGGALSMPDDLPLIQGGHGEATPWCPLNR